MYGGQAPLSAVRAGAGSDKGRPNGQKVPAKDKCAICMIAYKSDADFDSHWVRCQQDYCGYWVHSKCAGLLSKSQAALEKYLLEDCDENRDD